MTTPYEDLVKFYGTALSRSKPEWTTPNRIIYEDDAVILRRFDENRAGDPILIVPPQAAHHSSIADYAPGQSLVQTCLALSTHPILVVEWKPSTYARRVETIDDLVKQMLVCVKMAGSPVILAGLCQGGWLSAIYTAIFPKDVRALILAAAPIDFTAGGGKIQDMVNFLPMSFYQYIVNCGGGNMPGDAILTGFKLMNFYDRFIGDYLNLWINVRDEKYHERVRRFSRWYEYTQDLSGAWYLEVVDKLFKQNQLIKGTLEIFGERVDLGKISCPLGLLAGERDDITLVPQVHNLEHFASTPREKIFKAVIPNAGHISVFMGKRALKYEWPDTLQFIEKTAYPQKRKETAREAAQAV